MIALEWEKKQNKARGHLGSGWAAAPAMSALCRTSRAVSGEFICQVCILVRIERHGKWWDRC